MAESSPSSLVDPPADCLIDGPQDGAATVLLAHGAGAPMDSPFQAAIATDLADRGWRVVRFEFPYMARARQLGRRQAPDRMPVLQEAFRRQVHQQRALAPDQPLVVGGKSMGGRVASLLVDELATSLGVRGCLCFGFPFHPPGRPLQGRAEHLATLHTPTLILQGERDSFGRRQELAAVPFSPAVQLAWILDGDHSFRPGRRSGRSEAANLRDAVEHSDAFLGQLLQA